VREKRDLKIIVIEHVRYRKGYFTVYAHINEAQTAETRIECFWLCQSIAAG